MTPRCDLTHTGPLESRDLRTEERSPVYVIRTEVADAKAESFAFREQKTVRR